MAKETGLGMSVAVDDSGGDARTISNDVLSLQVATPRGVLDVTGVDVSAMERLLALADMSITLNMGFNDAANMSFMVFRTVPSTSVARTTTLGVSGQTLAAEMLYSDFQLSRGTDGSIATTAAGALSDGTVPTWA
jgi:hypothetical protein